eukprot:1573443-Rhodomonas_salina.5
MIPHRDRGSPLQAFESSCPAIPGKFNGCATAGLPVARPRLGTDHCQWQLVTVILICNVSLSSSESLAGFSPESE